MSNGRLHSLPPEHRPPRPPRLLPLCGALLLATLIGGCTLADQGTRLEQLGSRNDQLTQQLQATQKQLTAQQQLLDAQTKRIETLLALGPKRLQELYYPVRLEIDRLSGGFNDDHQPGDDGVVAYLRPIDADGHTLKAAGRLTVELFDLANPDGRHLVGRTTLNLQQARQVWYGRLWTHHYTVKCPWFDRTPPQHADITVKASFTDYLTGQTLDAQYVCKVKLPPAP